MPSSHANQLWNRAQQIWAKPERLDADDFSSAESFSWKLWQFWEATPVTRPSLPLWALIRVNIAGFLSASDGGRVDSNPLYHPTSCHSEKRGFISTMAYVRISRSLLWDFIERDGKQAPDSTRTLISRLCRVQKESETSDGNINEDSERSFHKRNADGWG